MGLMGVWEKHGKRERTEPDALFVPEAELCALSMQGGRPVHGVRRIPHIRLRVLSLALGESGKRGWAISK